MAPYISVCIPTYNRGKIIYETIKKILMQTWEDFEIVISDNNSSDDTKERVLSFRDNRIKYFSPSRTDWFSSNLNRALEKAQGEILVILSDDDRFSDDSYLERVAFLFKPNEDIQIAYPKIVNIVDDSGKLIKRTEVILENGSQVIKKERALERQLLHNTICFSGTCIRKNALLKMEYYAEDIPISIDHFQSLKAASFFDFYFVDAGIDYMAGLNSFHERRFRGEISTIDYVFADSLIYTKFKRWYELKFGLKIDINKYLSLFFLRMFFEKSPKSAREYLILLCLFLLYDPVGGFISALKIKREAHLSVKEVK